MNLTSGGSKSIHYQTPRWSQGPGGGSTVASGGHATMSLIFGHSKSQRDKNSAFIVKNKKCLRENMFRLTESEAQALCYL